MERIKVSGCIVTYNNEDIVIDCIESVLRETKEVEFKLYIVDNASIDNTVGRIREHFPEVTIIEKFENVGFGEGNNAVISKLGSEYHVAINPDIYMEGDVISAIVRYMQANRDVAMATPKILNSDGTEQFLPKKSPTIRYVIISKFKPFRHYREEYTRQYEEDGEPMDITMCTGCFFVIRTDVFKKLNGFDRRFFMYCEDADLSRRVTQCGRIVFYPEVAVTHRWKRDNTRSIKGIMRFMRSFIKYCFIWGVKW